MVYVVNLESFYREISNSMIYLLGCRCLGYHKVKGGYKEKDLMKKVEDEPVLAFPDHQVWSLLQFLSVYFFVIDSVLGPVKHIFFIYRNQKYSSIAVWF